MINNVLSTEYFIQRKWREDFERKIGQDERKRWPLFTDKFKQRLQETHVL